MKLYQKIASLVIARKNCLNKPHEDSSDWWLKHENAINLICTNQLPSGSGFNWGTQLVFERSNANRLLFQSKYQCMDEYGYYDGVIYFFIDVKPSLAFGFDIIIRCADKESYKLYSTYALKEYFHDTFYNALETEVE